MEFGEAVRTLALRGADAVLVPTASFKENDTHFLSKTLIPTRAFENGIYIAYVNHCGGNFGGLSVCCGPNGKLLVSCGEEEEGIFLATIKKISKTSDYLTQRRPGLYKDFIANATS